MEAKAKKRDICNGTFLTCDQLAQEVGFANYEQVKDAALKLKSDALAEALMAKMNRTIVNDKEERIKDEIVAQIRRNPEAEGGSQSQQENSADPQKRNEEIEENSGTIMKTSSGKPEPDKVENTTNDAKKEEGVEGRRDVSSWLKNYKKKKNPSTVSSANKDIENPSMVSSANKDKENPGTVSSSANMEKDLSQENSQQETEEKGKEGMEENNVNSNQNNIGENESVENNDRRVQAREGEAVEDRVEATSRSQAHGAREAQLNDSEKGQKREESHPERGNQLDNCDFQDVKDNEVLNQEENRQRGKNLEEKKPVVDVETTPGFGGLEVNGVQARGKEKQTIQEKGSSNSPSPSDQEDKDSKVSEIRSHTETYHQ